MAARVMRPSSRFHRRQTSVHIGEIGGGQVKKVGELLPGFLWKSERVEDQVLGLDLAHPHLRMLDNRVCEGSNVVLTSQLSDAGAEKTDLGGILAAFFLILCQLLLDRGSLPSRIEHLQSAQDVRKAEKIRILVRDELHEAEVVASPCSGQDARTARTLHFHAFVQQQKQNSNVLRVVFTLEVVVLSKSLRLIGKEIS